MNYTFHPHAEKELEQIENHYEGIREGLGNRFRDEIEAAISRILKFPNAWPRLRGSVRRRCRLNNFPYVLIYRLIVTDVRILAVMHDRREPDYWTYRT